MSNVHLDFIEDSNGDLVDILYYHHSCAPDNIPDWPNPQALDYPVYCHKCEDRLEEIPLTKEGLEIYTNYPLRTKMVNGEIHSA